MIIALIVVFQIMSYDLMKIQITIAGGVWQVYVIDLTRNRSIDVGTMMMEGDGSGMKRLGDD